MLKKVGLAILGLCLYSCYYESTRRDVGEHMARVSWLPDEASDVCYVSFHGLRRYEFRISEPGFLAWAQGKGWRVAPIRTPVTVGRYTEYLRAFPREPAENVPAEDHGHFNRDVREWLETSRALIENGFLFVKDDHSYQETVAYDQKRGRAYYSIIFE